MYSLSKYPAREFFQNQMNFLLFSLLDCGDGLESSLSQGCKSFLFIRNSYFFIACAHSPFILIIFKFRCVFVGFLFFFFETIYIPAVFCTGSVLFFLFWAREFFQKKRNFLFPPLDYGNGFERSKAIIFFYKLITVVGELGLKDSISNL